MTCYDHLIGEYVKVVTEREGREKPLYGVLVSEEEFTIAIKYESGDVIPIGKRCIIQVLPWNRR